MGASSSKAETQKEAQEPLLQSIGEKSDPVLEQEAKNDIESPPGPNLSESIPIQEEKRRVSLRRLFGLGKNIKFKIVDNLPESFFFLLISETGMETSPCCHDCIDL